MSIVSADLIKSRLEKDSVLWMHNATEASSCLSIQEYRAQNSYDDYHEFGAENLSSLSVQWIQFVRRIAKQAGKIWSPDYQAVQTYLKNRRSLIVFQKVKTSQLPWLRSILDQSQERFPHYIILSNQKAAHESIELPINNSSVLPLPDPKSYLSELCETFQVSKDNISALLKSLREKTESPLQQDSQEWDISYIAYLYRDYAGELNSEDKFILASLMLDIGHYYTQIGLYEDAENISRQAKELIDSQKETSKEARYLYINLLYQIGRIFFYQKTPNPYAKQSYEQFLEKAYQIAQEKLPNSLIAVLAQRNGILFHKMEEQNYEEVFTAYDRLMSVSEVEQLSYKDRKFSSLSLSQDLQHQATCIRYQLEAYLAAHHLGQPITSDMATLKQRISDLLQQIGSSDLTWSSSFRISMAKICIFEKNYSEAASILGELLTQKLGPHRHLEALKELIRCKIESSDFNVEKEAQEYFQYALKFFSEGHRTIYEMVIFENQQQACEFKEKGFDVLKDLEKFLETTSSNEKFRVVGYRKQDRNLYLTVQILSYKDPLSNDKLPKACLIKLKSLDMESFAAPSKDGKELILQLDRLSLKSFEDVAVAFKRFQDSSAKKQQASKAVAACSEPEQPLKLNNLPVFNGPVERDDFVIFESQTETCTLTKQLWDFLKQYKQDQAFIKAFNLPSKERKETIFFHAGGYRLSLDDLSMPKTVAKKTLDPLKAPNHSDLEACGASDDDDDTVLSQKKEEYIKKDKLIRQASIMQDTFSECLNSKIESSNPIRPELIAEFCLKKFEFVKSQSQKMQVPPPTQHKQPRSFASFDQEYSFLQSRLAYLEAKKNWSLGSDQYRLRLQTLEKDYSQEFQKLPQAAPLNLPNISIDDLLKDEAHLNELTFKDPYFLTYHAWKHHRVSKDVVFFNESGQLESVLVEKLTQDYLRSARSVILDYDLLTIIPNQRDPNIKEYFYRKRERENDDRFFKIQDQLTVARSELESRKQNEKDSNESKLEISKQLDSLKEICKQNKKDEVVKTAFEECRKKFHKMEKFCLDLQTDIDNLQKQIEILQDELKQQPYSITVVAVREIKDVFEVWIRTHFTNSLLDADQLPPSTLIRHSKR